jgi:hypothetical protein
METRCDNNALYWTISTDSEANMHLMIHGTCRKMDEKMDHCQKHPKTIESHLWMGNLIKQNGFTWHTI